MPFPEFLPPKFPEVTFLHDSFLMIDGKALELPDMTPEIFDFKVGVSIRAIRSIIDKHRLTKYEQGGTLQPIETIKLGRLSAPEREEFVLSTNGYSHFKREHAEQTSVRHEMMEEMDELYGEFWNKLRSRYKLQPLVESGITGIDPTIDGTWLSVKVNKK